MKSRLLLLVAACTLIACTAKPAILTYALTLKSTDAAKRMELVNASERMVRRRMASNSIGGTVLAVPTGDKGTLTVRLTDTGKASTVQTFINDPFTVEMKGVLKTVPPPTPGDEKWVDTGITGQDIDWVQVIGDRTTGKIGVEISFSLDGNTKLQQAFEKFQGGDLGIFVRGLLVSKLKVNQQQAGGRIIITGIPSAAIAQVFADDVNVGLHVQFTPQ